MPEGPEVKYLTDKLNRKLKGAKIIGIKINSGRYVRHGPPSNYDKFVKQLPVTISEIKNHGKFIYWIFSNEMVMFNTLGMSGYWTKNKIAHNHIMIQYKKENKVKEIYFNDMRNFGTIAFTNKLKLQEKLNKLGPDIMSVGGLDKFISLIKKRDVPIAIALLDQNVASGSGNYLRADALFLAKINPYTPCNKLTDVKIEKLWSALNQLSWYFYDKNQGIRKGIIDNKYPLPDKYNRVFLVYRQEKDIYGHKIQKEKLNGRTIHWSPKVQR